MSSHADDIGGSEGDGSAYECAADVDSGSLAFWVSRHDVLAEGFEAAHLRCDPAWDTVSGPALPERSAIVPCGPQGFITGQGCRANPLSRGARFFRIWMIATASRSIMVLWQRRVSWAAEGYQLDLTPQVDATGPTLWHDCS